MRKSIRSLFADIEKGHPHLKETLLSAMGNLEPDRLLDRRYLDLDGHAPHSGAAPRSSGAAVQRPPDFPMMSERIDDPS